jgi:hypothetical protein
MEVDRLRQSADRLASDIDHHDRVHEVSGRHHLGEQFLLDVDRECILFLAVHDGGHPAFAAQCSGGSLASPVARLGGQRQLFAHFAILRLIKSPAPRLQG